MAKRTHFGRHIIQRTIVNIAAEAIASWAGANRKQCKARNRNERMINQAIALYLAVNRKSVARLHADSKCDSIAQINETEAIVP